MAAWQQIGSMAAKWHRAGVQNLSQLLSQQIIEKNGHKRNTFGQNFVPWTVFQKCTMAPVGGVYCLESTAR